MKVVLFSGAGLSAPSKLPTYDDIKEDPRYSRFFSGTEAEAKLIEDQLAQEFSEFKPNQCHKECIKLQNFCEAIGIEFQHYTLNIDDMLEKSGGNVKHIYGCINDPGSILHHRFEPAIDLSTIEWFEDDILMILGVSDNGYPLAYLENLVLSKGGNVYHFNKVFRSDLQAIQYAGDMLETFSVLRAAILIPIEFQTIPLGDYNAHISSFSVGDSKYEVYFSPSKEFYTCPDEIKIIEEHTSEKFDDLTFEIKFDLESNRIQEKQYDRPKENMGYKELKLLGVVIASTIHAHGRYFNSNMYTASAAYPKLVKFYNRIANEYSTSLECNCWCEFGPKRVSYAFKF